MENVKMSVSRTDGVWRLWVQTEDSKESRKLLSDIAGCWQSTEDPSMIETRVMYPFKGLAQMLSDEMKVIAAAAKI